ncbi:fructose-1,6-bisphosphatase-3 [Dethiosulfatibacter aminovorans DSM 17477]|uniref:Fructose-1,6-bisphosphatase class 3 n=1 Tax=Dethiosulfatibacter aminovorans DSM 17477 TaxID=1121476 RepID=A0A1M6EKJ9_9FIRM|nr:fructose-1,6-bisphosphatase [Dethiosulfatibacter aminovorans]SHI86065.1 fructose-1,6-bisphosphatase-3 [Dethiosulfatibacter aminovorans DSM 17477]
MEKLNYYKLLSKQYRNIDEVSREIINLSAILSLPKGTEHFLTDIHGEYEAFSHVVRNASGTVKRKIEETFGDSIPVEDQEILASLVYYPKEKLVFLMKNGIVDEKWYRTTIYHLILLLRNAGYKYTRSKVRKSLPENFAYIIEELVQEKEVLESKKNYYKEIIKTIIRTEKANDFIVALADSIRRLVVDRLHLVGDIYDRGPGAHLIMDDLLKHHNVDIQWGNHDIIWMGAAAGSRACIANVLRICLRYGNLETLQDGYGINLLPLAQFAADTYRNDPVECFQPRVKTGHAFKERDLELMGKMQKAIAIIQFKLEGQIIKRQPSFKMEDRLLLDKMSKDRKTVTIDGREYEMKDSFFPTVYYDEPYELTDEENEVMEQLLINFKHSDKLQKHAEFLYSKGSIYLACNDNLLYHGCIPFTREGQFDTFEMNGRVYSGKALCDYFDERIRDAFFNQGLDSNFFNRNMVWYAWCGENSPLFGKSKMATFERYFIDEKETHKEEQNAYYLFRDDVEKCNMILEEFGLNAERGRIINGHVPVKTMKGENPVKAKGKMFVIDGGFSKAYQKTTGIAGYTLIFNSQAMILVSHEPFEDHKVTIKKNEDMVPQEVYVKKEHKRLLVEDTDKGRDMKATIQILNELLDAYRKGLIEQRF